MRDVVPFEALAGPAADKVEFSPLGLKFREALTFEDWTRLGAALQAAERAVHWWLGDWLVEGEFRYGEKYSQAVEATGFAAETLKRDFWVAKRFPLEQRQPGLSFTHHTTVTSLPEPVRRTMLAKAAECSMTTRELKAAVAVYHAAEQGILDPAPEPTRLEVELPEGAVVNEIAINPYEGYEGSQEPGEVVETEVAHDVTTNWLAADPPEPPKTRTWQYRAWYVTKTMEDDEIRCGICGETGTVGEVHLVRLEREEKPAEDDLKAHEAYLAELNSNLEEGQESYQFDWQGKRESAIFCARCLWVAAETSVSGMVEP